MKTILKLLGGSFGPYVMVAVAVTIIGLGGSLWVVSRAYTEKVRELGEKQAMYDVALQDNAAQHQTITALETAIGKWRELFVAADKAQKEAVAQARAKDTELLIAMKSFNQARSQDSENEKCQELLSRSIRLCPTLHGWLLFRAEQNP